MGKTSDVSLRFQRALGVSWREALFSDHKCTSLERCSLLELLSSLFVGISRLCMLALMIQLYQASLVLPVCLVSNPFYRKSGSLCMHSTNDQIHANRFRSPINSLRSTWVRRKEWRNVWIMHPRLDVVWPWFAKCWVGSSINQLQSSTVYFSIPYCYP